MLRFAAEQIDSQRYEDPITHTRAEWDELLTLNLIEQAPTDEAKALADEHKRLIREIQRCTSPVLRPRKIHACLKRIQVIDRILNASGRWVLSAAGKQLLAQGKVTVTL